MRAKPATVCAAKSAPASIQHPNGTGYRASVNCHIVGAAFKFPAKLNKEEVRRQPWGDRDLVKDAVNYYGPHLEFAQEDLRDDYEIVKTAVYSMLNGGAALKFASERLRGNLEIATIAVRKKPEPMFRSTYLDYSVLSYVVPPAKNDHQILLAAIQQFVCFPPVGSAHSGSL